MPQISHQLARLRLSNLTSERKHSWENPKASIGDFCRTMGRTHCWHAKGPARELFIRLAAEVKTYLDRNCEPPTRELHWSLYMVGQTKSAARPVLMFICQDSNSRKLARKTIKESGILLRYPGVDTADCTYPPDFGQLVQLALHRSMEDWDDLEDLTYGGRSDRDEYFSGYVVESSRMRLGRNSRADTAKPPAPSGSGQLVQQPIGNEQIDGLAMKPEKGETRVFYRPTDSILGSHVFLNDSRGIAPPSRIATAGVIVKLGDTICFLTAAHGFGSPRQSSDPCPTFEYDIDGESDSDDEEFLRTIRQGSCSPLSSHSDSGLGELENPISRSGSSQESGLNTGDTVTERATTDPTATAEATPTTDDTFQQTLDGSMLNHLRHHFNRSPSLPSAGLGAAALASVAFARNNSQNDRRSRSRYRQRSQSRGEDAASRMKSRNKDVTTSFEGATASGLNERARSKSRSGSKGRTTQDFKFSAHGYYLGEEPYLSGTLIASSAEGPHPSLDYALIKIEGSHASMANQLVFNNGYREVTLNPTRVSDSRPKNARVIAFTESSRYLNGRLLGTPTFSRVPDQNARMPSQELWTVKFDNRLREGDCGTYVFDARTGDLYGHVVAGNPDTGYAYIIPAHQVRDDLTRRFGDDLQFYKPAIHANGYFSKLPDRWSMQNDTPKSKVSTWVSSRTPLRDSQTTTSRGRHTTSRGRHTTSRAHTTSRGGHSISMDSHPSSRGRHTTSRGTLTTFRGGHPTSRGSHASNVNLTIETRSRRSQNASHSAAFVEKTSDYFTTGRIFVVRWSEPVQELRTKASSNSDDISVVDGQPMASYWRRMVVIKTHREENSSTCVGMFTYGGEGLAKPGVDLGKHALVFDERLDKPQQSFFEPSTKGPPLAVCLESPFEKLDPMYRINFGVTYTVNHNKEIRDVGHIAGRSMKDFETYVLEALKAK